jgi:hypothetical protein
MGVPTTRPTSREVQRSLGQRAVCRDVDADRGAHGETVVRSACLVSTGLSAPLVLDDRAPLPVVTDYGTLDPDGVRPEVEFLS